MKITLQISQGVEPVTALIDSSQSRLRPVMMASLTTISGNDSIVAGCHVRLIGGFHYGRTVVRYADYFIVYSYFVCTILSYKKDRQMKKEILSAIGIIAGILFGTTLSLSAQEKTKPENNAAKMALKIQ